MSCDYTCLERAGRYRDFFPKSPAGIQLTWESSQHRQTTWQGNTGPGQKTGGHGHVRSTGASDGSGADLFPGEAGARAWDKIAGTNSSDIKKSFCTAYAAAGGKGQTHWGALQRHVFAKE